MLPYLVEAVNALSPAELAEAREAIEENFNIEPGPLRRLWVVLAGILAVAAAQHPGALAEDDLADLDSLGDTPEPGAS